jgi:hypothetical protein
MQLVLLVWYYCCAEFGSDANCYAIFVKRNYILCLSPLFAYCFASSLVICCMSHRAAVEANRLRMIILFLLMEETFSGQKKSHVSYVSWVFCTVICRMAEPLRTGTLSRLSSQLILFHGNRDIAYFNKVNYTFTVFSIVLLYSSKLEFKRTAYWIFTFKRLYSFKKDLFKRGLLEYLCTRT